MRDQDKAREQLKQELAELKREVRDLRAQQGGQACLKSALTENEGHYRLIAQNVKDLLCTLDLNLRFTYVSPSITEIFGYAPEEAVGMLLEDLLTPYSMQTARETYAEEMAREKRVDADPFRSRSLELEARRKDGSTLWIDVNLTFLRAPEGSPAGILGIARDISRRKQIEEQLVEERDRAQRYLDVAGVMILAIGTDERVTLINSRGCEILGYSESEILGKKWFDSFVPERHRDRVRAVFGEGISKGESHVEYENPVLTKSGAERTILWCNTILRDEGAGLQAH